MRNSIRISFEEPSNGWLPLHFVHENLTLVICASDVLNDPIEELYNSIIRLKEGRNGGDSIMFWLEPAAYFFYFEKKSDEYSLTISEIDYMDDPEDQRTVVKIIHGTYKEIIAPFEKLLTDFHSKIYSEEHWPYKLNKEQINKLM